jgi:DNA-binding response OmpR family regulator
MTRQLLVIDDSPTIRKLVEISFKQSSIVVEFAGTGGDGAARAARNPPDLVLLDYVLPDMSGVDVCRALARDPRSASVPVMLMSAKHERVRPQFAEFESVVDFIGKPFTIQDITARVEALIERRPVVARFSGLATAAPPSYRFSARPQEAPADTVRSASAFTFAQKEAAAKAMYAKLRPALGNVADWLAQAAGASPGETVAKKLLTRKLLDDLLDVLVPTLRDAVGAPKGSSTQTANPLHGELSNWGPLPLLEMIAAGRRTGNLELTGARRTIVHFRRGEIVMASTSDVNAYLVGSEIDLSMVPKATFSRAESEQVSSLKPVFVTLAELGQLSATDIIGPLSTQTARVVVDALESSTLRFEWTDMAALPLYVESHGRPVSLAQVALVRARLRATLDADRPKLTDVFERQEGFSRKLQELTLDVTERRVLALVNGTHTVGQIADRSSTTRPVLRATLLRLGEAGLIRERRLDSEDEGDEARRVYILEPDEAGFVRPLEELLRARRAPAELLAMSSAEDLELRALRAPPQLIMINATELGDGAFDAARRLRSLAELERVPLAAVLERSTPEMERALFAAGFTAVLTKPVAFTAIDQLIDSGEPARRSETQYSAVGERHPLPAH